ncbi:MAG: hypothetical protein AAF694_26695 [Bacteroidota bacterium]
MHYVEYIYLVAALMVGLFMVIERSILSSTTVVQLSVAVLLFSGMYVFRRKQRIKREKLIQAELHKLKEKEAYED